MASRVGWVGSRLSVAWPGSDLPREGQILLGYPQLVSAALEAGDGVSLGPERGAGRASRLQIWGVPQPTGIRANNQIWETDAQPDAQPEAQKPEQPR